MVRDTLLGFHTPFLTVIANLPLYRQSRADVPIGRPLRLSEKLEKNSNDFSGKKANYSDLFHRQSPHQFLLRLYHGGAVGGGPHAGPGSRRLLYISPGYNPPAPCRCPGLRVVRRQLCRLQNALFVRLTAAGTRIAWPWIFWVWNQMSPGSAVLAVRACHSAGCCVPPKSSAPAVRKLSGLRRPSGNPGCFLPRFFR